MALFQSSVLKKYLAAREYRRMHESKALALQADITRLDREIDALVYELYGLTEEEIKIVEGGEG